MYTLSFVEEVDVLSHCTVIPSCPNWETNFSQLAPGSWITQILLYLDYYPKVTGLWNVVPLSLGHSPSNGWSMQWYKCLVSLLQTGTNLKGHPDLNMIGWVFVAAARELTSPPAQLGFLYSPQMLTLRAFSNRLLLINPINLHLCSPGPVAVTDGFL